MGLNVFGPSAGSFAPATGSTSYAPGAKNPTNTTQFWRADGSWGTPIISGSLPFVNIVTDFGADPTGVASISTALTNAIAALDATYGGTIVFPVGQYLLPDVLTITHPSINLVGMGGMRYTALNGFQWKGGASILTNGTGGLIFTSTNTSGKGWGAVIDRVHFLDLVGGSTCLTFSYMNHFRVRDCVIHHAAIGILVDAGVDDASWGEIERCNFTFCSVAGIRADSSSKPTPTVVIRGGMWNVPTNGIGIHNADLGGFMRIHHPKMDINDGSIGIQWDAGNKATLENVNIEMTSASNSSTKGIWVTGTVAASEVTIIAPQIQHNNVGVGTSIQADGFSASSRSWVSILGGSLSSGEYGIKLGANVGSAIIGGIKIRGMGAAAVSIASGCKGTLIANVASDVAKGVTGGVADAGTDTQVVNWSYSNGSTTVVEAKVQPLDTDLTAIAALSSASDTLPYATGVGAWALTPFTSAARALLDDTDAATMRTTLGISASAPRSARVVLDGGGSALTTGPKKVYVTIPFTGTITKWRIVADQTGSIVLDVWKDVYANFPPTVADTITASAKPTLSSAASAESTTLTGWTTAVTAGDILEVNVDSIATVTKVYLDLYITPS